jgi:putative PEP-CTERM system TPR-repeat lipoprotein
MLALGVIASVLSLTAGCKREPDGAQMLQDAQAYMTKGDAKSAVILLKNAAQKQPNDAGVRYQLGTIYNRMGDPASAEKEFRRALELNYDREKAVPQLGWALLRQGQFDKALKEISFAGEGQTDSAPEILVVHGNARAGLGQLKEAKAIFVSVIEKRAEYPDGIVGLARIAAMERDFDGALVMVERALAVNQEHEDALMLMGDLLRVKGKPDGARAAYSQAIKANPFNVAARINRASMLIAENKLDAAAKEVDEAKLIQPGNLMAVYMQALLDFRRGKSREAQESLRNILKVAPSHLPTLLLAGAVEHSLGSFEQASRFLQTFLDKLPNNLYARKLLVSTLIKGKQVEQAERVIEPALKDAPDDVQVLALAGETYMLRGNYARATEYLEKASSLNPNNAALKTGLGLSRLAGGETQLALADLESAAALDTGKFQADSLLVLSHLSNREYNKALKALEGLEKKQPNNPFTFNLRGTAYLGKNDVKAARENFERAIKLDEKYFPAVSNLARLDLIEKKPDDARKRFEVVLNKEPKNMQAMLGLAGLAVQTGKNKDALTWLERARADHPDATQPTIALIRYYLETNESKQASRIANEALAKAPNNPELLDLLGLSQLASLSPNEAITTFTKLTKVRPNTPLAHYRLASAEFAVQNLSAAESALRRALDLKPDFLDAQISLASVLIKTNRYDDAMLLAQKVRETARDSPVGHVLMGDVLLGQSKPGDALKAYDAAYKIRKSGSLALKMYQASDQFGRRREGEARLQEYLNEHPDDADVRLFLADQQLGEGNHKAAAEQYQAVLKLSPDNLVALNNLAWSLHELKDPRAVEYAEQAYKKDSDNAAIMDTLGKVRSDLGEHKRGLELLQGAVARAPGVPDIRFHFAQALAKAGDPTRARAELEMILASGKKFSQQSEARALLDQLKK